jgi:hypothetical protein
MLTHSKSSSTVHWQICTRDFKILMNINTEYGNRTAYGKVWKAFDISGCVFQNTEVMQVSEKPEKKSESFYT